MREIKFRGYSKEYKTMFNYDYLKNASDGMVKICQQFLNASDIDSIPIAKGLFVPTEDKDMTLMQYTGLKDNTKWEKLTDKEKTEFYKLHCSEDGRTIKYQHIEDVKHLWEGKEIYEGDIIQFTWYSDSCWGKAGTYLGHIRFDRGAFQVAYIGKLKEKRIKKDDEDYDDIRSFMDWSEDVKVIASIYERPELLKV